MTLRALLFALPAGMTALAGSAVAQNTLTKETPFVSASAPTAEVAAETIEFAGVMKGGSKTELIFNDKAAKKTRWVPLGGTVEGITALNYDERLDQAVVKINGVQKTLPLRKGAAPVNAPAPVPTMATGFNVPTPGAVPPATALSAQPVVVQPAPMTPTNAQPAPATAVAPTPTPATPQDAQAKQETEARMLVSDLLEIGMAQRKAYEEAQRKAQGGTGTAPANPAASATPPGPTSTQPAPGR